jgi:hypothetical protein
LKISNTNILFEDYKEEIPAGEFFWILPRTKEIIEVTVFGHKNYVLQNFEKFLLLKKPKKPDEAAIRAGAIKVSIVHNCMSLAGLNIKSKTEQIHQLLKRYPGVKHITWSSENTNRFFDMSRERFLSYIYESIAVDLDRVLAYYDPESDIDNTIGDPIDKMVDRVRDWLKQGKKVKIFTARASQADQVDLIQQWLKDNNLPDLDITNIKLPEFEEFWDDKAKQVVFNTGLLAIDIEEAIDNIIKKRYTVYLDRQSYKPEFQYPSKNIGQVAQFVRKVLALSRTDALNKVLPEIRLELPKIRGKYLSVFVGETNNSTAAAERLTPIQIDIESGEIRSKLSFLQEPSNICINCKATKEFRKKDPSGDFRCIKCGHLWEE